MNTNPASPPRAGLLPRARAFLTAAALLASGGTAARADFMLVALPDTQYYSSSQYDGLPAMYTAQTDWIQANRSVHNIAYVAHLGDMTDHGDTYVSEWQVADDAMSRLESPVSIPYGACVGNHDQSPNGNPTGSTTKYNQYFGPARFSGRPYYGGYYGSNNDSHFDLFTADGENYIVIYIEYDANNAQPGVLTWASNLLTSYSSRKAIIVSHYIGDPEYPATFGAQGQRIYNAVSSHSNVFLMLSGHVAYVGRRQDRTGYFGGQAITTLVSNYQFDAEGGGGYMRLYTISTANNTIKAQTYSPYHGLYNNSSKNAFQIQKDWLSRLDVFYRGSGNTLRHKFWNGSAWSTVQDLGGSLSSDPAAVSRGANLVDVVYRGSDGKLWWRSYDGTAWGAETSLGDTLVGKPAICSYNGLNRLDVFYRGSDNALKHRSWNGTTWSAVESIAADMGSDPAAVAWGPYRIDVFYRGRTDDDCHRAYYDSQAPWVIDNLGGNLVGAPGVASWAPDRLDVFARGTDNRLWHKNWNGSVWSAWTQDIVTGTMASAPAAASWASARIDQFHKGTDGKLWQVWWNSTSWQQQDMGVTDAAGDLAVASWSRF